VDSSELNETGGGGLRADELRERSSRGVALVIWSGIAMLVAAASLLWLRFGSQVFLDAASTAWKSCF
jgi:hypothetical protein